jgi:plastocyanin
MKHDIRFAIAALTAVLYAGCGSAKKEETAATETPAAPAFTKVDPATAGTIKGKILFTGKRPAPVAINMSQEAACKRAHSGPVYSEQVVVNPDGTLANVFVYIKTGLEGKTFEVPKEPVTLNQHGCMFRPHVLGIRAGQTFLVANSDPVTHNIHPQPTINREWNQGQPPGSGNLERVFARPEVMIPVKCNVHAWMRAYIGVVDHPYFAVTGDQGTFEVKGIPPGEYAVEAWHEKYGTQEQKISLTPSAVQDIEFTYRGS